MIQADPKVSIKIDTALKTMLQGSVPVISIAMLADAISCEPDWVILDSRELAEYEISHLPGARWIGYSDFSMLRVSDIPKQAKVLVYCSIGVRSENIAEKLITSGFTHVRNLYGGLFAWANEHKILVAQDNRATLAVHGYDKKWARLLNHHVYCLQT